VCAIVVVIYRVTRKYRAKDKPIDEDREFKGKVDKMQRALRNETLNDIEI
jgi:hypothetical protein